MSALALVAGTGPALDSSCRLMAAADLHRGSSACSPASGLCCSDHITPSTAISGNSHCLAASQPLLLVKQLMHRRMIE